MKQKAILWALALLLPFPISTQAQEQQNSPDLVVHLLDYLAKDYAGAVQDGMVISPFEYTEQVDFAQIVEANSEGTDSLSSDAGFMSGVRELRNIIDQKGPAEKVATLARQLQQDAIRLSQIKVAPSHWPDLTQAPELYRMHCALCHGEGGRGDGPGGAGLDPAPSDFTDPDLAWDSSPYKFYNTIRLGVPGTGMAAYSHLSDSDVWALAFYLKSLAYGDETADQQEAASLTLSLEEIATLTDAEIAERAGGDRQQVAGAIGALRAKPQAPSPQDPVNIAKRLMAESMGAAESENFAEAQRLAIRAYLEGVEPIEPKLQASAPGYVAQIESLMTNYRASLSKREPINTIAAKNSAAVEKLSEIQKILSENRMSSAIAFGAAFSIFLREGFEAILIIVVLISILRAMDQPKAVKWVHVGWTSALAVGVAAWFASGLLLSMSGLSREVMEGAISLLAVAVLIYVGFWLHRYSEAKRWRKFLEAKLKQGLSAGSYFGIALVAFMAVFREAFEVVLFLRAIWMDLDSSGQTVAGMGVLSSFGVLLVLSYFFVKKSANVPMGLLFKICSWTMMVLAVILAGKGIHSLQEAGVVSISPVNWAPHIDLLGIYPNLQTLLMQLAAIALFALLLTLGKDKATSPA